MKPFIIILSIAFSMTAFSQSIYDFQVTTLTGETLDFTTLKGKKVMIVNTASKCGYTSQYEQLEEIYSKYKSKGFVVIGFPSNDFMKQEPGTNEEIAEFCKKNYGVTFPMMDKISVKGKDIHPVYSYLTTKSMNKLEDNDVKWNFQKYLIDEKGQLVRVVKSGVSPNDASIVNWIEGK